MNESQPDGQPAFVPGLELSGRFYFDVVQPIVFDTPHAAARLGWGSDVLGFDTERSTDHGWGPRVQIFVEPALVEPTLQDIDSHLPPTFMGWPTRFGWDAVAPRHWVEVLPFDDWIVTHLGFDPRPTPTAAQWLTATPQFILGVVKGAVFHDPDAMIAGARTALQWYPDDLWRFALASVWLRIAQEEHLAGRAAEVGDHLGSRIIVSRLVRDVMKLAFLLEREYAPYPKWFGTAFSKLRLAAALQPQLEFALSASSFVESEDRLMTCLELCGQATNALNLCAHTDTSRRKFHARPFDVIDGHRFVAALQRSITDEGVRALPLIGTIDVWSDNTDVLERTTMARSASALYRAREN